MRAGASRLDDDQETERSLCTHYTKLRGAAASPSLCSVRSAAPTGQVQAASAFPALTRQACVLGLRPHLADARRAPISPPGKES
jgi:hypothetical protein